MKLKWWN